MSILVDNLLLQGDGILMGGVDEAGRGSIVGPLVVAGIGIRESKIALLYKMGIKDSKALNPKSACPAFWRNNEGRRLGLHPQDRPCRS